MQGIVKFSDIHIRTAFHAACLASSDLDGSGRRAWNGKITDYSEPAAAAIAEWTEIKDIATFASLDPE